MHHRGEVVRSHVGAAGRLAELGGSVARDVRVVDRDVFVAVVAIVLVRHPHGVADLVHEAAPPVLGEVDGLPPADPPQVRAAGEAVAGPDELHVVALTAAGHEVDRGSRLPVLNRLLDALPRGGRRAVGDGVGHLAARPTPLLAGIDHATLHVGRALGALAEGGGIDARRLDLLVGADDDVAVDECQAVDHLVGDHLPRPRHGRLGQPRRRRRGLGVARRRHLRPDQDRGQGGKGEDRGRDADEARAAGVGARQHRGFLPERIGRRSPQDRKSVVQWFLGASGERSSRSAARDWQRSGIDDSAVRDTPSTKIPDDRAGARLSSLRLGWRSPAGRS